MRAWVPSWLGTLISDSIPDNTRLCPISHRSFKAPGCWQQSRERVWLGVCALGLSCGTRRSVAVLQAHALLLNLLGGRFAGRKALQAPRRLLLKRAVRRPEEAAMSPQAARLPQRFPPTSFPCPTLTLRAFLATQRSPREALFALLRPFGCSAIRPWLGIAVRPRSARPQVKEPRHERCSRLPAL